MDFAVQMRSRKKLQYRKQGFAYQAVSQALEHAKHSNIVKAVVQVRKDNCASRALHKKLGEYMQRTRK